MIISKHRNERPTSASSSIVYPNDIASIPHPSSALNQLTS
jgi:hypothetical protein